MAKIGVTTINLNLPDDTIRLLSDLKRQLLSAKTDRLKLVVVDNGSSDDSVQKISHAHPDVTILPRSENIGVAGGYNVGLRTLLDDNCDYAMVINNDMYIEQKSFLKTLLQAARSEKNIGVCGPMIYFAPKFVYHHDRYSPAELSKVIWYAGGIIDPKNVLMSHRGVDLVDRGQFKEIIETDFVTGACMLFPTPVLRRVGLFNEKYFAYLEDVELSTRIRLAGFRLTFNPRAKIYHKVSQTSDGIGGTWNDYYITRNRLLWGLAYSPVRTKLALLREAGHLLSTGRPYQQAAVRDFLLGRLGRKAFEK